VALFVGYIMDKDVVRGALIPFIGEKFFAIWLFLIRYVAPLAIIIIMLNETGILKF